MRFLCTYNASLESANNMSKSIPYYHTRLQRASSNLFGPKIKSFNFGISTLNRKKLMIII